MSGQKEKKYFENINEEYKKKYYPDGSVFEAYKKSVKGANANFFIIIVFLVGSICGFIWSINRTLTVIQDEEDLLAGGIAVCCFFLLLILVFVILLYIMVKDMRKSVDDWIRIAANAAGCSEQEIREFDRQALQSDSLILNHLGKLQSFASGQKNGILTREYICFYGKKNMPCVLKLSQLIRAYLMDNTYYIKVGNTRKKVHYLTINLESKDGKTMWAETSQESARELQKLLEQRCPDIDTAGGAVLSEKRKC